MFVVFFLFFFFVFFFFGGGGVVVLVDEGSEDPTTIKSGSSSADSKTPLKLRIEMAFHLWPDNGTKLNAGLVAYFVIFQGIRTSYAKKPYRFVISGGFGPPAALWTCA